MQPNESYRTEKDFLDTKAIPADAYYGIQTLRAVENFPITGYRIHETLITSLDEIVDPYGMTHPGMAGAALLFKKLKKENKDGTETI